MSSAALDTADADTNTGSRSVGGGDSRDGQDGDDSKAVAGTNELGSIDIADKVVQKIAARAAAENPDAGAAATRVLGVSVPGAGSDLDKLPKTSVDVDGSLAFVQLQLAVRWPCSVADTTKAVRRHVAERVEELTGLTVQEVDITVTDLVTDIAAPPRVH